MLGTLIGALPGAGADIAAWVSYAMSKKLLEGAGKIRHRPHRGHRRIRRRQQRALAGAWIPALVFGIPGDSITAIVIGVLYMKGMNPGRRSSSTTPQNIYAIFLVFILANLLMLPLGWAGDQVAPSRSCACRATC